MRQQSRTHRERFVTVISVITMRHFTPESRNSITILQHTVCSVPDLKKTLIIFRIKKGVEPGEEEHHS